MPNPSPQRQSVLSYLTPRVEDLLFYELVDLETIEKTGVPEFGTPHPEPRDWPTHKLVYISPADEEGRFAKFYYAAARSSQDDYNWEHTPSSTSGPPYNAVTRTYVTLRSEYDPDDPAPASAMPVSDEDPFETADGYILLSRVQRRIGDRELDSIFVVEQRVYIQRIPVSRITYDEVFGENVYYTESIYYKEEGIADTNHPRVTGTLTASDGTTPVVFPTLEEQAIFNNGKPRYVDSTLTYSIEWDGAQWSIFYDGSPDATWTSSEDVATPDLVTTWTPASGETGTPVVTFTTVDSIATLAGDPDNQVWGLQNDGVIRTFRQLSENWYAVIEQEVVPLDRTTGTAAFSYTTTRNYTWPAVLYAIDIDIWNKREGGAVHIPRVFYARERYSGPCAATITATWSKDPHAALSPDEPMQGLPIVMATPYFSLSVPATLHDDLEIDVSSGTEDKVYEYTAGTYNFERTNYLDWPSTFVAQDTQQQFRGGWLRERVVLAKPAVSEKATPTAPVGVYPL